MAQTAKQNNETFFEVISRKINTFLTNNKNVFIIGLIVILVSVIGIGVSLSISDSINKKSIVTLTNLEIDLENALARGDAQTISDTENNILEALKKFTLSNKKSFSSARAHMLAAEIYYNKEEWILAMDAYALAYTAAPQAYTAGLNAFNAAVCAEKSNQIQEAFDFYNKALLSSSFTQKPRTLFNLARLEESRNNSDSAKSFYQELISTYPNDEWALLAKSRQIFLTK